MHEFFIVQNLLKTVEDYVAQYNAKKVSKLVLLIGKFSGVEPDLLQSALEFFKKGTVLEDAEIVIEIEEFKVKCLNCGKEFSKGKWDLSCPYCGSLNTQVISGEELILKSLELED
jgi:hydrogenase nickel incorporation protein HypA/HybF